MKSSPAVGMLLIATIMQNVSSISAYAGYGIAMPSLIAEFGISRSTAALGTSLLALVAALMSPFVGRLVDRWSLRKTALLGVLFGTIGLGLASVAPNFAILLFGFSVLGGLANVSCGSLPSSSLASRWFPGRTGTAVAICMLPILVSVGPLFLGKLIGELGWRGLISIFAGLYLFLLLPVLCIRDHPPVAALAPGANAVPPTAFSARALLRQPAFWYLLVAIGILFSTSVTLISHVVSAAIELGTEQSKASMLISIVGVASALGGLAFGWLGDRIGPALALIGIAAGGAIGWAVLALSPGFIALAAGAALTSFCGGGAVISPLSAYIAQAYGRGVFGQVFGLIKQMTLPLLFALPIVVGALVDASGGYRLSFLSVGALCGVAAILLFLMQRSGPAAVTQPV